jgi:hypothetical protein
MRNRVTVAISILAALCIHGEAVAGTTSCTTAAVPYCTYSGKVVQVYVNESNLILLFLDTNFTQAQISGVGITGVSNLNAVSRDAASDPEFTKLLFATMLAAKASDATVNVQMRGVFNGYLEIDRIWLK